MATDDANVDDDGVDDVGLAEVAADDADAPKRTYTPTRTTRAPTTRMRC